MSPTSQQQRVPSPQELIVHTQQILQGALIRRKLEEQKENFRYVIQRQKSFKSEFYLKYVLFRRRQGRNANEEEEQQQQQAAPIPFMPTAVMKKIVSER